MQQEEQQQERNQPSRSAPEENHARLHRDRDCDSDESPMDGWKKLRKDGWTSRWLN